MTTVYLSDYSRKSTSLKRDHRKWSLKGRRSRSSGMRLSVRAVFSAKVEVSRALLESLAGDQRTKSGRLRARALRRLKEVLWSLAAVLPVQGTDRCCFEPDVKDSRGRGMLLVAHRTRGKDQVIRLNLAGENSSHT